MYGMIYIYAHNAFVAEKKDYDSESPTVSNMQRAEMFVDWRLWNVISCNEMPTSMQCHQMHIKNTIKIEKLTNNKTKHWTQNKRNLQCTKIYKNTIFPYIKWTK